MYMIDSQNWLWVIHQFKLPHQKACELVLYLSQAWAEQSWLYNIHNKYPIISHGSQEALRKMWGSWPSIDRRRAEYKSRLSTLHIWLFPWSQEADWISTLTLNLFILPCDFKICCWRSIRGERPAAPGEKESTIRKVSNAGFKEMARFPRFNSHVNNLEHYIVCFWLSRGGERVHSLLIWSNDSLQERGGRLPCALYILTFTIHLGAFLKGKHFSIKICIDVHGYGRKFKQEQHLDSFST